MSKWKMCSIKHSGTCGERGTERQEPYYLARNNCLIEFLESDLNIGKPARLFYSPLEENHGNGILTSPVVDWKLHEENGEDMYILETQNSIFGMKLLE